MKKQWSFALKTTVVFALGMIGVTQAWAQNGVIGFGDVCNARAYVMRGEAESTSNPRVLLPLPPPISIGGSVAQFMGAPLDVSTTGPVTVLLPGLFAVQVDDIGGILTPAATAENLRLPEDDPSLNLPANTNSSSFVRFSPLGDRVAIVTSGGFLVIADTVLGEGDKIIGLTQPTVVANLLTIGAPSDTNVNAGPLASFPDFSPDRSRIVVTIYNDLWLLDLDSAGYTLVSAQPLTRTVRDTEWQAVFSPDGSKIAYIGGMNKGQTGIDSRYASLYTLNLSTREISQVTPRGAFVGLGSPAWSPDGQSLAFTALGSRARRTPTCGDRANYDVFQLKADGTGSPTQLTNTVGTAVEYRSQWGF